MFAAQNLAHLERVGPLPLQLCVGVGPLPIPLCVGSGPLALHHLGGPAPLFPLLVLGILLRRDGHIYIRAGR